MPPSTKSSAGAVPWLSAVRLNTSIGLVVTIPSRDGMECFFSQALVMSASSGVRKEWAQLSGLSEIVNVADRIATGRSSVLILGETGAGKEWLARRIHSRSGREGPFVAVNCAAIPEGLAESELFGHVRGAFTGALRNRRGHFEIADGGTLFLDEVAELSKATQVRLLRVLQERTIQPVGSERSVHVDVRVLAATNQALEQAVQSGAFRKDLFYRLAVVTIDVPPLRDRPGDVRELVRWWVETLACDSGRTAPEIGPEAWAALLSYHWPGNIRELVNVLERASLLDVDGVLAGDDLPPGFRAVPPSATPRASLESLAAEPFRVARQAALARFELRYLADALTMAGGRVGEAARIAGISQRSLYEKMRQYGLRKEDFRAS